MSPADKTERRLSDTIIKSIISHSNYAPSRNSVSAAKYQATQFFAHQMSAIALSYPHLMSTLSSSTIERPVYLIFYSPPDPVTHKLWCPDCRAVEEPVRRAFNADGGPKGIVHWVGQRDEWRKPDNEARAMWNVHNVPTILKLVKASPSELRISACFEAVCSLRYGSAYITGQGSRPIGGKRHSQGGPARGILANIISTNESSTCTTRIMCASSSIPTRMTRQALSI